jgi:hypothetical protein
MINSYTIRHHNYGILFSSPIPFIDYCVISKCLADVYGLNLFDVEIAQHYHASACLTTKEKSALWRKELGLKDG